MPVGFIAELRQASDLSGLPVGRRVVVIGGGMTAIERRGAIETARRRGVTICYRVARAHERFGVRARTWPPPTASQSATGCSRSGLSRRMQGVGHRTRYTALKGDKLAVRETLDARCDQVFKAIGQSFVPAASQRQRCVDRPRSRPHQGRCRRAHFAGESLAGGDCIFGGDDLTVSP